MAQRPDFTAGRLVISPSRRLVRGPAGEAHLEPLTMHVFLLLLDARGEVVTRKELFNHCWGDVMVGDASLNRIIARLRKIPSETGPGLFAIETVPRTGYRLGVHSDNSNVGRGVSRRAAIAGASSSLLLLGGLSVWRMRGNAYAEDARPLIDRGDVLLRDAVPMQAGDAVPPLSSALKLDPDNVRALGLLALAEETSANNGGSTNAGDTLQSAEKIARAALARDPKEPHASLAMIDITAGSLSWSDMEDRLEALRASAPANVHVLGALSSFLQAAGRTSRSWVFNEQAAAAAPTSPTPQWRRVLRLWTAGRTDQALSLSDRLLPLWPRHALVWNARFMLLAFTGRTGAALAMLRNPWAPMANAHPARPAQWVPTLEAFAEPTPARVGKAREANLAAAQRTPGEAQYATMALSQLGEVDDAFEVMNALLLNKGPLVAGRPIEARSFVANSPSWCRTQWLFMPPLAAVRRDARFKSLCSDIGLARYWRKRGVGPDTSLPEL